MSIWKTFTEKLKYTGNKWTQSVSNLFSDKPLTEEFWDELEESMIAGDVGLDLSETFIERLRDLSVQKRIAHTSELKKAFADLIAEHLEKVPGMGESVRLNVKPAVIILTGVNGSGKTTTAAKLAAQLKSSGKKVIMAAADTFRAAAIDQLKMWGERVGVRVIAHKPDSDPAAVVYDAIMAAKAAGDDAIIVDTAGRLHTKSNLMEELSKIARIVKREIPEGPAEVFIVLDAVMGQNGFIQAETFNKAIPATGVVLTKFDNTSKGGMVMAIAEKLALPVRYVGLGEGMDDLGPFDPKAFAESLLSMDQDGDKK
jgi:fused signal recognition particle receptor